MTTLELSEALIKEAEHFLPGAPAVIARNGHMHAYRGPELAPELVAAVLTMFINNIAGRRCIDLALYASDLSPVVES